MLRASKHSSNVARRQACSPHPAVFDKHCIAMKVSSRIDLDLEKYWLKMKTIHTLPEPYTVSCWSKITDLTAIMYRSFHVMHVTNSWERESARSVSGFGRMLRDSWHSGTDADRPGRFPLSASSRPISNALSERLQNLKLMTLGVKVTIMK